jgi:hypothetical protein
MAIDCLWSTHKCWNTLEMLEHKRWYTDAETQMRTQMLQHKCWYTDAATQNANTDAATQVRTQMLSESQMYGTRLLEHEC